MTGGQAGRRVRAWPPGPEEPTTTHLVCIRLFLSFLANENCAVNVQRGRMHRRGHVTQAGKVVVSPLVLFQTDSWFRWAGLDLLLFWAMPTHSAYLTKFEL